THATLYILYNILSTSHHYILPLHDALPICTWTACGRIRARMPTGSTSAARCRPDSTTSRSRTSPQSTCCGGRRRRRCTARTRRTDRKSTRLNSSHQIISYAVFCLKNKIEEH